eukprot:TRINITY_DN8374_c6_g1_i1.p1 TRINITY_DN8374_c6_g1~~TRINITY_DN8374_c6_g1_i1.p1  ORF type:complete len:314 (+),score=96.30 TRINITY_DN8374_c6_g1_i1:50-943(+)
MLARTSALARNVMVLGGGTMGAGISQVAAVAGHTVRLVDLSESVLGKSKAGIEKSLTRVAGKKYKETPAEGEAWVKSVMGNIEFQTDSVKAVRESDLVIEAIVENLDIKNKVWSMLDKEAPEETIFASNTSSLAIKDMAVSTSRPDRFGGLHFFSPVPMMKLVEVVSTEQTSKSTTEALTAFSKDIGKTPIACKDTKGFVVNRLLVPLLMEAIRMVERGDASIEDIDTAMKLGAGHPMGPLMLSDAIGNDVIDSIIHGWHKETPEDPLFNPSPLLSQMVADGKLGIKAGKGWYSKDA